MGLHNVDDVLAFLDDPRSERVLREYFGIDAPPDAPVFSGRRFNLLEAEWPKGEDQNRITAADLVAVQCLSVTVPIDVALDLLEGELGRELNSLLAGIPTATCLGTPGARALVEPGRETDKAWWLLEGKTGVGYVTAGKLLARKRPRLIPVWDGVVRCAWDRPDGVWLWLNDILSKRDGVILQRLDKLRADTGIPEQIPLLRVLDVVVWMRHRGRHLPGGCPGLAPDE